MGVIWTSKTRARQPQGLVRLHPEFSGGDGFAWTPTFIAEARTGAVTPTRIVGTQTGVIPSSERAAYAVSNTDGYGVRGRSGHVYNRTLFISRFVHQGSVSNIWGYGRNDGPLYVEHLDLNVDETGSTFAGKFRFNLRDMGGTALRAASSSAILASNTPHTLVLVATSSSTVSGWLNGVPIAFSYSATGAAEKEAGLPDKEFAVLNLNYGSGNTWSTISGAVTNAGASLVARLDVPDAASIGRELSIEPWQIFAPERRPVFFSLGAGGGSPYSMDADAGSYSVTGVAATFKATRTLVAETGSYTLTGVSAGLSYGHSLTAEAGSYSVTGVASTFLAARTIAAGAGSYAVSGQDATFTYTPVGSGSPYSMDAETGSYTLTGVGATFQASRTLLAAAGSYALTGVDASFTRSGYRLVAETGSYVISGQSATFSTTGTTTPTTGGGGGKGHGSNLSRKQKKKLKAVESQEWLKAEETARQLLSDRFTKQTPQEKAQALETYIESLQPVIEALKALTSQIEEVVEEAPVIELTPHQEVIQRFERLEKKVKSVEELIIILMADL